MRVFKFGNLIYSGSYSRVVDESKPVDSIHVGLKAYISIGLRTCSGREARPIHQTIGARKGKKIARSH